MEHVKQMSLAVVISLICMAPLLTYSPAQAETEEKGESSSVNLPLSDIRLFTDIYARIKKEYVEEVDDEQLLNGAIRGMMSSLDPHSVFLSADEFKELQIDTSGEFGGLGIEVGMENGVVRVIAPIEDTPADKAGVKAGDLIIKLDDTQVKGLTLNEAVKLMRGKRGTDILLTIAREGESAPIEITVTRDVIKVKSVRSRILEAGYGYLRISSFQSKTTRNVLNAMQRLKTSDPNLQGLILDLRNNPGGILTGAVGVSDLFLDDGKLIVYTKGRGSENSLKYTASTPDFTEGIPILVLINEGSASASEIVAGALQDHDRAIIMGKKSFGKGSVQTVLPLQDNNGIKLTTSRYYTPNGRSIQAEGIKPDILVKTKVADGEEDKSFKFVRESDLAGHLEKNLHEKSLDDADTQELGQQIKTVTVSANDEGDAVLNEALNILKQLSAEKDVVSKE